jgi:hypothetical protein
MVCVIENSNISLPIEHKRAEYSHWGPINSFYLCPSSPSQRKLLPCLNPEGTRQLTQSRERGPWS